MSGPGDFRPGSPVEGHLDILARRLWLLPFRRSRLLREARDHLLEETERQTACGLPRWEAESVAVERFGVTAAIFEAEARAAGWLGARLLLTIDRAARVRSEASSQPANVTARRFWRSREETRSRLWAALLEMAVEDRQAVLQGLLRPQAILVGGWLASGHRCCPLMAGAWENLKREPMMLRDLAAAGLDRYETSFYAAFDDWARAWSFETLDADAKFILTAEGRRALMGLVESSLTGDSLVRSGPVRRLPVGSDQPHPQRH